MVRLRFTKAVPLWLPAGTVLAVSTLLAAAAMVGVRWSLGNVRVVAGCGLITAVWPESGIAGTSPGAQAWRSAPGWRVFTGRISWGSRGGRSWITVPVWAPVLLGAGTIGLVICIERRRLAGCCSVCGYSLAGLARGTACPECGKGG
jgi:hypothetical protein